MLAPLRRLFARPAHSSEASLSTLSTRIRWVAEALSELSEFSRRAHAVANEVGPAAIQSLAQEFHTEHTPPDNLAHKFPGLGEWMAARQFAIFEILYHIGPSSLPLLRRVAFGEYDWTQGNAIEILCRFAARGMEREEIILELQEAMPNLRYEALVYAAGPLRNHAKTDPDLQQVVEQLLSVPAFKDVCDELSQARA